MKAFHSEEYYRERYNWFMERHAKTAEVVKTGGFHYGNGKSGVLTVAGYTNIYDLRYNSATDLHMAMLKDYFGKGLVKATEI